MSSLEIYLTIHGIIMMGINFFLVYLLLKEKDDKFDKFYGDPEEIIFEGPRPKEKGGFIDTKKVYIFKSVTCDICNHHWNASFLQGEEDVEEIECPNCKQKTEVE